MKEKQSLLDSFYVSSGEDANEKLFFKNDILSTSTAWAASPYLLVTRNDGNVTALDTHYYVRTELHLEL